jgi:hypothetical protein
MKFREGTYGLISFLSGYLCLNCYASGTHMCNAHIFCQFGNMIVHNLARGKRALVDLSDLED